jgi:hypothetical protein
MIYSQAEGVFILHHYFALKSHAVHETFSNAQPDKEVWSKTMADQLVNKMFGHRKCLSELCSLSDKMVEIQQQEFNVAIGFIIMCVKGLM